MKKTAILGSLLSALPLASAAQNLAAPPIQMQGVIDLFKFILSPSGTESELVARVLIFLLLAIVLYKPSYNIVGKNEKWGVVLSVIVSTMAVRFLDAAIIKGMMLPYGAIGITISIVIPFILLEYFFLFQDDNLSPMFRTAGYAIMLAMFLAMWWFRWTDLGDLAYYYLWAAAFVIAAWSLDGSFRKWLDMSRIKSREDRAAYLQILDLEERLEDAINKRGIALRTGDSGMVDLTNKAVSDIEKAIKTLRKSIH
jgi:hypothetical protein